MESLKNITPDELSKWLNTQFEKISSINDLAEAVTRHVTIVEAVKSDGASIAANEIKAKYFEAVGRKLYDLQVEKMLPH